MYIKTFVVHMYIFNWSYVTKKKTIKGLSCLKLQIRSVYLGECVGNLSPMDIVFLAVNFKDLNY